MCFSSKPCTFFIRKTQIRQFMSETTHEPSQFADRYMENTATNSVSGMSQNQQQIVVRPAPRLVQPPSGSSSAEQESSQQSNSEDHSQSASSKRDVELSISESESEGEQQEKEAQENQESSVRSGNAKIQEEESQNDPQDDRKEAVSSDGLSQGGASNGSAQRESQKHESQIQDEGERQQQVSSEKANKSKLIDQAQKGQNQDLREQPVDQKSKASQQKGLEHPTTSQAQQGEAIEAQAEVNEGQQIDEDISEEVSSEDSFEEEVCDFYSIIKPFVEVIGNEFIPSFMHKKVYSEQRAAKWSRQLSDEIMYRILFEDTSLMRNFDYAKFYQRVEKRLNRYTAKNDLKTITLDVVRDSIKRFKFASSCFILQKRPVCLNISTSCFWNKDKDGMISFEFEADSAFVSLTLFAFEKSEDQIQNEQPLQKQEEDNDSFL